MGNAATILISVSAGIILALGVVHLIFTFHGTKLTPRDAALYAAMRESSPVISRQTTLWKAWVGFNASHSMGAIFFGLIYGYLALAHAALLFQSAYLLAVGRVVAEVLPADIRSTADLAKYYLAHA